MAVALLVTGVVSHAGARERSPVKLVLQITVDGLRGDLLNRYGDRFGKGGFRYLLEMGAVFANAHHSNANTETIVGHSTLATGAHPSEHGMAEMPEFMAKKGMVIGRIHTKDIVRAVNEIGMAKSGI